MSAYRCLSCRQYHRATPYRRVGLGSVCSEACWTLYRMPKRGGRPRQSEIPDVVRGAVRERDRNRCRMCGITRYLDEHHIAYRSEGGTHDERNLILLCREHHDLVHTDKRRWQPVLFAYIRAFYGQGRRPSLIQIDQRIRAERTPAA